MKQGTSSSHQWWLLLLSSNVAAAVVIVEGRAALVNHPAKNKKWELQNKGPFLIGSCGCCHH